MRILRTFEEAQPEDVQEHIPRAYAFCEQFNSKFGNLKGLEIDEKNQNPTQNGPVKVDEVVNLIQELEDFRAEQNRKAIQDIVKQVNDFNSWKNNLNGPPAQNTRPSQFSGKSYQELIEVAEKFKI